MKKTQMRSKVVSEIPDDEILPEYDLSSARPNPYAAEFGGGRQMVILDPDVARDYPDSEAVNSALRGLKRKSPRSRAGTERKKR